MDKIKDLYVKYREVISYLFWGVVATAVSWGTYAIFEHILKNAGQTIEMLSLQIHMNIFFANVLSWTCAFTLAFFANKLFVFQSKSWKKEIWLPEFTKFFSARVFTGILEIVLVPVCVALGMNQSLFGIEGIVAKIFVSVIAVVLNYIFSKLFIFKEK